jgi:hypothetical protein
MRFSKLNYVFICCFLIRIACLPHYNLDLILLPYSMKRWSRDSSVGLTLGYGLDNRGSRVRFPVGAGNFSLHHRVQDGSGAHSASYQMGTRSSFPWREADHSPPSSAEVKEWVELYLHYPNTPSWRGAQLKTAQGQLHLYLLPLYSMKRIPNFAKGTEVWVLSMNFRRPDRLWGPPILLSNGYRRLFPRR